MVSVGQSSILSRAARARRQPKPTVVSPLHPESGQHSSLPAMREDYFKEALEIVGDPYDLVNMIWERMQMLRRGDLPLVESLERLPLEDVALREIIEGRIAALSGVIAVQRSIHALHCRAGRPFADDVQVGAPSSPRIDAPCNAAAPA
jgi:DNA-directed RNA polymerase subunit omega